MSARVGLRPGETLVVVVSPIAQGVLGPLLIAIFILTAVAVSAHLWVWPRAHDKELALIALPALVVLAGRTFRWWRHRVVITSERIVETAGVLRRHTTTVNIASIEAIQVHQERRDRLMRRGSVVIDVVDDSIELHRVRRPDVFVRVVEYVRFPPEIEPIEESSHDIVTQESPPIDVPEWDDTDDAPLRWRHLFGDGGRQQ